MLPQTARFFVCCDGCMSHSATWIPIYLVGRQVRCLQTGNIDADTLLWLVVYITMQHHQFVLQNTFLELRLETFLKLHSITSKK